MATMGKAKLFDPLSELTKITSKSGGPAEVDVRIATKARLIAFPLVKAAKIASG